MKTTKTAMALALLLALALLPLAALAEELGEILELPAGEEVLPGELPGEFELPAPEDALPEPTPEATAAPEAKPEIPWLTSYNYPEDKLSFEGEIWAILTDQWGLEDFQAAGLMSSLRAESGFCPYNAQSHGGLDDRGKYRFKTDDSVGFGLGQWTSSGRKAALLRHAEAHGSAELVWDFDIQMGFMGSELDMAALMSTRTLYEATEWSVMFYERPDQRYENSWPGARYGMALELYRAHTGEDYREPKLRWALRDGAGEAVGDDGVALAAAGEPGQLTLRANTYWRLEIAGESEPGWLSVTAPAFGHLERLEACACGYVCDGDKPLTLAVEKVPPLGETFEATLRFEFWREEHVFLEVPVRVTCTARDYLTLLGRANWRAATLAVAAALESATALAAGR